MPEYLPLNMSLTILKRRDLRRAISASYRIPHHGSRRNVGPTILNRLLGNKVKETPHGTAFVSAPKENPEAKHPAKKVINAFRRRGYPVHATQGQGRVHYQDHPQRDGWISSTPLPFYTQVEDSED